MKKILDQELHSKKSKAVSDRAANLRIEVVARARLSTPRKDYISSKDMDEFLASL